MVKIEGLNISWTLLIPSQFNKRRISSIQCINITKEAFFTFPQSYKDGYLHVGEIYTSYEVVWKPHKIPSHVWYKKTKLKIGKSYLSVFNTHAYGLTIQKVNFYSKHRIREFHSCGL